MFSSRIRAIIITLTASLSFAGASLIPAAAQAQWHTICFAGHCMTHTNYTIGGVSPCVAVSSGYTKDYEGLLEAIQEKKEQALKVHPEMTQEEAQAAIEEAEAQVHSDEVANFEWGCGVALRTSPGSAVKVIKGSIYLNGRKVATIRHSARPNIRLTTLTPPLSAR